MAPFLFLLFHRLEKLRPRGRGAVKPSYYISLDYKMNYVSQFSMFCSFLSLSIWRPSFRLQNEIGLSQLVSHYCQCYLLRQFGAPLKVSPRVSAPTSTTTPFTFDCSHSKIQTLHFSYLSFRTAKFAARFARIYHGFANILWANVLYHHRPLNISFSRCLARVLILSFKPGFPHGSQGDTKI